MGEVRRCGARAVIIPAPDSKVLGSANCVHPGSSHQTIQIPDPGALAPGPADRVELQPRRGQMIKPRNVVEVCCPCLYAAMARGGRPLLLKASLEGWL